MDERTTIVDDSSILDLQRSKVEVQRPVLMLYEGEDIKNRYTISKPELVLGRDVTCDITLMDTKSSRRHARIDYQNFTDPSATPKVHLIDLGSTNGTYLNGDKIFDAEVKHRDKIMIGSSLLSFFLHDDSLLKAEQKLIELASNDALTTLRNRAVFDMEIQREFERARRYGRDLTLIMFDLDHFKLINDMYGHPAGDQVLREVGSLTAANARLNDFAARYGGEEFAVVLPETPMKKALVHAQRLRRSIATHSFNVPGAVVNVTISLGMADLTQSWKSAEELINAADQALYAAKRAGRNRVQCYGIEDLSMGPEQTG